jgi:NAD(P)-dependent dehydrogenase (short-subunit alcohol dehydrogenase family)
MIAMVTGANRGIGFETVRGLVHRGARVAMVSRDRGRGAEALDRVRAETGNDSVELYVADLSSISEVRALAARFAAEHDRLDVLINNHNGIFDERLVSVDGIEMNFALNYLAYFLLATKLRDALERSGSGRIVNVAAEIHRGAVVDVGDLFMEQDWDPILAFRRAKFCVVTFTNEFARRLQGTPVTVNALHPGSVETASLRRIRAIDAARRGSAEPRRYPEAAPTAEGARLPLYLATSAEVAGISGAYFVGDGPVRADEATYDPELGARLWARSEELTAG